ncbi:hypothetical protein NQZ68_028559 [Dissostichus eleginoides]|nr:hypothetical protein NQZ68_028559 [Dissostichus eleginoides]
MPILKNLPLRLKGGGPTLENAWILRRMSLNITPHHHQHNPFDNGEHVKDTVQELVDALYVMTTSILERITNTWILRLKLKPVTSEIFLTGDDGNNDRWSPGGSLLDGDVQRDRNPFEDEEDENEANEGKKGSRGGSSGKGSFNFKSPLKSLGKLGKNLRMSARSKGSATPSPQGTPSPAEKKKRGRRSSEGSLLRFAGKYRDSLSSRKESITNGEQNDSEGDTTSRRLSFMKMVGLGKMKRESMNDSPLNPEEQPVEEEVPEEVKPREPLSVLDVREIHKKDYAVVAELWYYTTFPMTHKVTQH